MPNEPISFSTKDNCWIEIKCNKSCFNIVGLSADEFPKFSYPDKENYLNIQSFLIKEMIDKTYFSISNDETKYNLNGVFAKINSSDDETKKLFFIATDGHRLSMIKKDVDDNEIHEFKKGIIFPKKGIFEVRRIAEEEDSVLQFGFMENNAVIKKDNTIIIMRLVDGEFPDYERVIPKQNEFSVVLNRYDFLHALRRISVLSNEKSKGIKISLKNNNLIRQRF